MDIIIDSTVLVQLIQQSLKRTIKSALLKLFVLFVCQESHSNLVFAFPFKVIKEFRDDEMEHHDTGLEHDAESVRPYFTLLLICFLSYSKLLCSSN